MNSEDITFLRQVTADVGEYRSDMPPKKYDLSLAPESAKFEREYHQKTEDLRAIDEELGPIRRNMMNRSERTCIAKTNLSLSKEDLRNIEQKEKELEKQLRECRRRKYDIGIDIRGYKIHLKKMMAEEEGMYVQNSEIFGRHAIASASADKAEHDLRLELCHRHEHKKESKKERKQLELSLGCKLIHQ